MNFTHQMEDERVSQKKNIGKKLLSSLLVFSFVLMFSVPALAATRKEVLSFGVLLWCEEESCAGKWLRPHCPCKIEYTRFYEKSHYISVKNQKSS